MSGFFNKLIFLFRKIFTKKTLIYIIIFLIIIILKTTNVNAFSYSDLCYQDLPQEKTEQVFNFIQQYNNSYDSYFGSCFWSRGSRMFRFLFFNHANTSLYVSSPGNDPAFNYMLNYTSNDNIYYVVFDENFNIRDELTDLSAQIGIRNYFDSDTNIDETGRHLANPNYNCIVCNRNIYTDSSLETVFYSGNNVSSSSSNPYIINWEDISTWGFSTLNISGGSQFQATIPQRSTYTLFIYTGDYYSSLNIKPYMEYIDTNNHIEFYVPRQYLLSNYNIQGNERLHLVLKSVYTDPHTNNTITDNWDLGYYTLSLSSQDAGIINSNSDKQQLTDINNSIQNQTQVIEQQTDAINQQTDKIEETTDAVNNLNDTMTDSNIDTGSSDLPSINVNDPTQNGINNIFQLMYNAFCVGDPQDIVFPFPYTNRQIVIPINYLRNNLENSGSSWIVTFIQAFWGYIFGGYVIFDITEKMNKIKEGNIEELEKTNIKEDML